MLPVRCNNHPWMQAFVNVSPNPFFAVSGENGHFEIRGCRRELIHWWQSTTTGQQQSTVTVKPQGSATADFNFASEGQGIGNEGSKISLDS